MNVLTCLDCSAPINPIKTIVRSDCPLNGSERDCINDNTAYSTFEEAWNACATVPECDLIQDQGPNFYLRRASDPQQEHSTFWIVEFPAECKAGNVKVKCMFHVSTFLLKSELLV